MKVLHLFSNAKRTGPAELAINLCASLRKEGAHTYFACCNFSSHKTPAVQLRARKSGIEPITQFHLTKHFDLLRNVKDVFRLTEFLDSEHIDIIHAHLNNDHLVGGLAAKRAGRKVRIVRSCYESESFPETYREHYMLRNLTDALVVASERAKDSISQEARFDGGKIFVVPGAVDLQRFDPYKKLPDMRPEFGLSPNDFVVGIVARIQPHRRFDVLFEAMRLVSQMNPTIKLLLIGRGSKMEHVAVEPVKRMGLEHCVKFGGYHRDEKYVAALACFDAKIFLVPGSDGTCRAVREAMAMAKPIIAARRGMLPEIVDHGVNGLIVEDTPSSIAEAVLYLSRDPEATKLMGLQAVEKCRRMFSLERQARAVADIYSKLAYAGAHGSIEK